MADWRDRRVPEFQAHLRNVLGREPTERDYAAAIMQLEARGPGSIAVGHAFRNRIAADGGDPASHLRHYDPVALGHRWREVTPAVIDKWGSEYDKIAAGEGPLRPGQTHFFSPAGMQAYYAKDPSLVRSAVRMDVPGHGEVLVPSWATKAVAAGDFVNVNGQWHLTPNERYGQDVASPAPSRDAAPRQDAASAPPPSRDPAIRAPDTDRSTITSPSSGGQAIEAAMRVARAFGGAQPEHETESIIETRTGGMPRARQMAEAPIPYMDKVKKLMILTRADGGPVDPPAGGAGRFASPVPLTQPDNDTFTRRVLERLTGGGRLPYAAGGGIDDTGANIPETRDALMAQQRQLIEGRRPAQMFPRGTDELPVPPGMRRIETARGVFHYDPMQISARDIEMASIDGRENEVLGLGPLNKADVTDIGAQTGEGPVVVTERDRGGNEVRASVATPSTVPLQADDMLRSAAPGHIVDVEPVGNVVGRRQHDDAVSIGRASGGGISDIVKGIAGSGLLGIAPMAMADGVDPEDILSPMAGLMQNKARGGGIGGKHSNFALQQMAAATDIGPLYSYMVGGTEDKSGRSLESGADAANTESLARRILRTPSGNDRSGPSPTYRFPFSEGGTDSYPVPLQDDVDAHMRKKNKATGGGIGGGPIVGALAGSTGGRADKIPATARSGSHVVPADVVAHMGQGNTNAGLRALERMFKTGPYGMALSGRRRGFADGGDVGSDIPVMLSDGEFVVPPEVVASLGDGHIQTGHDVLDAWIMDERAKHIETLQALPPPATD